MAEDPNLPSPGDVIAGKYRIERLIGHGGMGAVFAAEHTLLHQRVALKLLRHELTGSLEATARFMNEARAAARIQGEHVARVLDISQLPNGTPFMVLEYLDGSDLAALLRQRGPLAVAEVADYALQALDALAQAHAAGIIHRDLKPANLFLARRHDGTSIVKVLDFGIAKSLSPFEGSPSGMTSTRAVLGSPEYMSPEQLRSPRDVDARTDIWSLGVILYELLAGRVPFHAETLAQLFISILQTNPPPIRALRPDVPPAFEAIIARCMAREPEERFSNVADLAAALMVFASDPMRALAAARGSARAASSSPPAMRDSAPVRTANTAAPWSNSAPGTGAGKGRSRTIAIIAAAVFGLSAGGMGAAFVAKAILHRGEPAASADPPGAGAAAAPAPRAPTESLPSLTSGAVDASTRAQPAPADTGVATPPARSPAIPSSKSAAPQTAGKGLTPKPSTKTVPPPAPAASKSCSPNFYFDKDGNKRFKPECF